MEVSSREDTAFGLFAGFERVKFPARGRNGGGPGQLGTVSLKSGVALQPKGLQLVPAGERLVVEMPGGGGMGPAAERDPDAVRRDVRLGYLSAAAAARDYAVDGAATGGKSDRLSLQVTRPDLEARRTPRLLRRSPPDAGP
jgi:N-methylhydantoinase B